MPNASQNKKGEAGSPLLLKCVDKRSIRTVGNPPQNSSPLLPASRSFCRVQTARSLPAPQLSHPDPYPVRGRLEYCVGVHPDRRSQQEPPCPDILLCGLLP